MKFASIRYMKRKNLGNYEHEELEVSVIVDEGEKESEILSQAKSFVYKGLGLVPEVPVTEEAPKKKKKAAAKKSKSVSKKAESKEEIKEEEARVFTLENCRDLVKAVAKKRGMPAAKEILSSLNVEKVSDLSEDMFRAFCEECEKCLK